MNTNNSVSGCAATPGEGNATASAAASGKGEGGSFGEALHPPGAFDTPTDTQRIVLVWEADGYAELECQTGLIGGALHNSIRACKRRGWLDANGMRTDAGTAALVRAGVQP